MSRRPVRLNLGLDRFSGLYLAALFIIVFGIWTPNLFLTQSTLHSVAAEQAITAMMGVALLIPLATGAYDLSVGATINMSAILAAQVQSQNHWGIAPAILLALGVSLLIGVVNGLIVVVFKVNSFIATLGMATVIAACQAIVTGSNQPLPPESTAWSNLTQQPLAGFQIVFLYMLVLAAIVWWVMTHTPAGRYMYAVGGNSEAARLSGINVGKWTWLSLIASAFICGIAGVFYSSLNGPSLTFGSGLLLPAFAAAFLGSTQLVPGRFNVWGTLIAVYVLAIGVKGIQLVSTVQWANDMFNGVALIVAVAFAVWRQQRKGRADASTADRQPARPDDPQPESVSSEPTFSGSPSS